MKKNEKLIICFVSFTYNLITILILKFTNNYNFLSYVAGILTLALCISTTKKIL